ncbi:DUF4132 domain-containing protein [Shigella flexneri]
MTESARGTGPIKRVKKRCYSGEQKPAPRLETALRTTRRWSLADFHSLFVNHPFTRLVTQRLIWGVYLANEPRCLSKPFVWPQRGVLRCAR